MRIGAIDLDMIDKVDLGAIDLEDPELYTHGDPHLMWAALRQRDPVHRHVMRDGRVYWSLTRFADVSYALRDHTSFTAERGVLLDGVGTDDTAGGRQIDVTDGPRHRPLRDTLYRGLNATLDAYENVARKRIHDIVAGWPDGEPIDLAGELVVFPMVILGDLMNLPEQDWSSLVELSTTAVAYDDARPARIALFSYLQRTLHQRRRNPMDDLFGSLMTTEVEGRRLGSADVVCNTYNVLLGANVTLPHTATSTLLTLMEEGRYREWRESAAEATSTGVDEAIRWGTAANHFLRYTTQEVELPGGTIPAGDAVALWLSSANRDEEVFDDPFVFDIRRQPNKHLGFGVGSHYCVGYAMAKLCLRVLFEEIIDAVEDMQPAGPVEHLRSNLVAGYTHVPVIVRRRHGSNGTVRPQESTDS